MSSKHILLLLILMICISLVVSRRRRRRRSCSRVDCQVNSWSSWSACSKDQCGKWGTRQRTRTVQVPPLCGGTPCPSLQEGESCQGTLRVDCKLSPWSKWSACSQPCGGSQTSTRYVVIKEQCGGTPCNTTLSKRQPCSLTQCLNQGTLSDKKCFCLSGYYGSCCQYNVSQIPACNNCCSNTTYTEINNPRRSTKSLWNKGENDLCDRDLPLGWYRFTSFAGGKIPEHTVIQDHCGTRAPVWLNGRHPSKQGQNVVCQACVNNFDLDNGCWEFFDINIMNCGDYFVYYLRPPDYCSVAYCAGYMEPCPYGKEGEPPNCVDPPEPFSSDNLGHPEISYKKKEEIVEVTLICKVDLLNGIDMWQNVTYSVEWFAGGKSIQQETICGGLLIGGVNAKPCLGGPLISQLSGKKYKIGQWITCNVSATFSTSFKRWSLPKTVQKPFYAGIQVHPTSLLTFIICDYKVETITLTPTIPARRNKRGWPKMSFWMPKEIQLLNRDKCETQLEGVKAITLKIKATCPESETGATQGLKVIIPHISNKHSQWFWNNEPDLPAIWISVLKPAGTIYTCKSVTDPHYSVLDPNGVGSWFDFMGVGDFLLYRNTERNFEVQTRQWACNDANTITCNCGVILRDHNDVIEFSCCNDQLIRDNTTPITVKKRSKNCLAPRISISNVIQGINGEYEVLFPSGPKVIITRNHWGLDVTIKTPRPNDINNEKGLCLYSGPNVKAQVDTYGYKLRLESNESYFVTLPSDVQDGDIQYSKACLCPKIGEDIEPRCESVSEEAFPNLFRKKMNPVTPTSPTNSCDRQKRDVHYLDNPTEEDIQLFKETPQLHSRLRREVELGSVPKENATRYCAERISETKIGKLCAKIGVNVQALVNTCSADVELTGDFSYATGSVALLMNECGELGARNLSMLANYTGDAFIEQVAELLCPNDCMFNGKCVNGSCVCNKDYTAQDCSMSIYQIPTISRLQGDGLCDKRKRPCRKVTVLGTDFLNSTNMTCHVKEFKVVSGSWTPNNTELRFPGVMTDLELADCYLPESPVKQGYFHETDQGTPAAGLIISVSNDGEHKSNKNLTFISYDSACMSCNVSTGCSIKNNSCFINRYCFAPNETNPLDWCYQCLPEVSANAWTKRQVNLPPKFSKTTEYFAVLQEILELSVDVIDPEGIPVKISLMDGSPSKAVVHDNVLIWNVTNDAKTQFFLKATDACQATSYANITVSLVVCQCQNNGTCVPHPNKPRGSGFYECQCVPGYTGDKCETDIDECQAYPCIRGRCIDRINNYTCICDPGYVGGNCAINYDDCSSSPCIHGKCVDYTGTYRCSCDPGYSGRNCTIDIDDCESSPCKNGVCVDHVNNYTCQCQSGYTGYDCYVEIDECQSSPCVRGKCLDKINNFTCVCPAGFTGVRCEVNIDDCLSSPCVNGTCIDLVNNYTCNCYVGFTGPNCDIKLTNCTDDACYPNVTCFTTSDSISCGPCPLGLSGDGKNCEDIDYCINNTCGNGGSCVDGISNYSCACLAGFTGEHCNIDIDECISHQCGNGGSCVDGVNNYSCSCLVGFTGYHCETDVDYCVNITCNNSGSCVDGISNYSCNCKAGYSGDHCEADVDECISHQCGNGGSCVDGVNSYSCSCLVGFTGDHCETVLPTPSRSTDKTTMYTSTNGAHPATEQPGKELIVELRIRRPWDNELKDKSSEAFKLFSDLLENEIRKQYSKDENFQGVKIISFKPGSVLSEFKLVFRTKMEDEVALAPLKRGVEDGKMGSLNVYPESLKIVQEIEEPTKEDKEKITFPLAIGVSCGGVFVLILLAIFLVHYCQQRNKVKVGDSGDGAPTEVAFQRPDKYELQEIELKKDSFPCGKPGLSGEPGPIPEVGIRNAAADYN